VGKCVSLSPFLLFFYFALFGFLLVPFVVFCAYYRKLENNMLGAFSCISLIFCIIPLSVFHVYAISKESQSYYKQRSTDNINFIKQSIREILTGIFLPQKIDELLNSQTIDKLHSKVSNLINGFSDPLSSTSTAKKWRTKSFLSFKKELTLQEQEKIIEILERISDEILFVPDTTTDDILNRLLFIVKSVKSDLSIIERQTKDSSR
jgi:hypothetical protein